MKLTFILLAFVATLFSQLHALEEFSKIEEWVICEKTYFDPEQVEFNDNNIWLDLDGHWIRVPGVHADHQGFYFNLIHYEDVKELASLAWRCHYCGGWNEDYRDYCRHCGKPR